MAIKKKTEKKANTENKSSLSRKLRDKEVSDGGKVSKKELEEEVEEIEEEMGGNEGVEKNIMINRSKPIAQVKKGDKVKIDGQEYEVDAHYVLIDHGTTKEMTIEIFDKNDKDYQLRYFNDQVETTLEFYELQEIMYIRKPFSKIEW